MGTSKEERKRRVGRPSPAMVVAIFALVMSTAGTATAAKTLITSSSQVKNGSIKSIDIADGTLTAKDVKDGALTGSDLRGSTITLDKLAANAREAIASSQVNAYEAFRHTGPTGQPAGKLARVATLRGLKAGVYAIFAKSVVAGKPPTPSLLAPGDSNSAHCVLDAGGDKDHGRTLIGGPGVDSPGSLHTQITHTFAADGGEVSLECEATKTEWSAANTSIIAVRVGSAPRQSVDG